MKLMVHVWVDMDALGGPTRDNFGSREWLVVGLKSRAASAGVTKHLLLFSVNHVINMNSES